MKKLSLKNLKLEANDLLQREQLKTVFGGYGGYGGYGGDDDGGDKGCGVAYLTPDNDWIVSRGVSKKIAKSKFQHAITTEGYSDQAWCCDSCSTASWY